MKESFRIKDLSGVYHLWIPLSYSDFDSIIVPSVCVIHCWKDHCHKYGLEAFFYRNFRIISCRYYRTKKELFGAIHFLLQENLNVDVQFTSGFCEKKDPT